MTRESHSDSVSNFPSQFSLSSRVKPVPVEVATRLTHVTMAAVAADAKQVTREWPDIDPCDRGRVWREETSADAEALARATSAGELTLLQFMRRSGFRDWEVKILTALPWMHDPARVAERDAPKHVYFPGHGNSRLVTRGWNAVETRPTSLAGRRAPTEPIRISPPFAISFQHPVLRALASDLARGREDVSAELLEVAAAIVAVQRQHFTNEVQRTDAVATLLKPLFEACGLPFQYVMYRKTTGACFPDIALGLAYGAAGSSEAASDAKLARSATAGMIQVKPPQDTSPCDPWSELCACYLHQVRGWQRVSFDRTSSMPCVLATLHGTQWEVGCGVVEKTAMAERLSSRVSAGCTPPDSDAVAALARRLRVWAQAVHDVARVLLLDNRAFRKEAAIKRPSADVALAFPHFLVGEHRLRFVQHLGRGAYRATWQGAPVVFKATRYNNDAVQNLMAAEGWAPRIHACETVYGRGGEEWKGLVMEDLVVQGFCAASSESLQESLSAADTAAISKQVGAALALVHSHGFVFFDVRLPNIMVRKGGDDGEWCVRLVDFEMCGCRGSPLVRTDLNEDLTWPPHRSPPGSDGHSGDARSPHILHEDDDEFMLRQLWDEFEPLEHGSLSSRSLEHTSISSSL